MGRKAKSIEAAWSCKEKVTPKSLTEMGFAAPNEMGLRPRLVNGAQSVYDPQVMPKQAFVLCSQNGSTLEEMGALWGVTGETVARWVRSHKEFAEAVRTGREHFTTQQIENSLSKRALGYFYEEVTVKNINFKVRTPEGTKMMPAVEETRVTRHVPADVTAIIFYLKNRAPGRWRDRQELVSLMGQLGDVRAKLSNMSVDDLRKMSVMLEGPKEQEDQSEGVPGSC